MRTFHARSLSEYDNEDGADLAIVNEVLDAAVEALRHSTLRVLRVWV